METKDVVVLSTVSRTPDGQGEYPRFVKVEYGAEFQSQAFKDLTYQRSGPLDFIRPRKHVENAFLESCNGLLRDECLNVHPFASLAQAQAIIEASLLDHNQRAHIVRSGT